MYYLRERRIGNFEMGVEFESCYDAICEAKRLVGIYSERVYSVDTIIRGVRINIATIKYEGDCE